jgi:diaminobutyrate-2-oxoglutarate transaminase
MEHDTIERLESEVRTYCRSFPTVFSRGRGAHLFDERGRGYIDFLAGAGALNYGHNQPHLRHALVEYIASGGITHSLDLTTQAKVAFLESLEQRILIPRGLSYKVMFPGPTGTNAVEAALKLARKVTGRQNVVGFTNGFHGMTLGALSVTGNKSKRLGAGVELPAATTMPFDGYLGEDVDSLDYLASIIDDDSSGLDKPAAFIVETVQAEGGINVAGADWLTRLAGLARRAGALLIVDDIQVGCGRTSPFFSFEGMGVEPDIVCLSKSLSGFGLPLSVVLMRPDIDVWKPGEHNGTFRGNNHAFVTARAAIEHFWADDRFSRDVAEKGRHTAGRLAALARRYDAELRGRGMIQGLAFEDDRIATAVSRAAFAEGLVIETAGPRDEVVKVLPPLTIQASVLDEGLDILAAALATAHGDASGSATVLGATA